MIDTLYDYDRWPNFTQDDLECQHTGLENPNIELFTTLMDEIQILRTWADVPFHVNSAYRSHLHPIEARKKRPGMHSIAALDFRVKTKHCHRITGEAFRMGFTGIGINLTGNSGSRFIHLDKRLSDPRIWSY